MKSKTSKSGSMPTTAQLADHLGLSRWTVSRVLNGHEGVLPETVRRVHEAMEELGFQPNAIARSLRGGRTGMIGVCFQELNAPVLTQKVTILQELLRQQNYNALIELTNHNIDLEKQVIQHFLSMKVEGIVLVGSFLGRDEATIKRLACQNLPVVWLDPEVPGATPEISLDRGLAMKTIIEHFHELGHRKLAILGADPDVSYGDLRLKSIWRTIKRLGIDGENDVIHLYEPKHPDHDYNFGMHLGKRLLTEHKGGLPTAILAINDRVAVGVINALSEAGLSVPGDISIVGFDNMDITPFLKPKLTTVDQQVSKVMKITTDLLLQLIENPDRQDVLPRTVVKPKFVIRESTASVK